VELSQAKGVIASYLAGRGVSGRELEEALYIARSDREYVEHLKEELGAHGDWVSECDIFLSRLAEFVEMSVDEKRGQCPELVEHVSRCACCGEAYWQVASAWAREESASADAKSLDGTILLEASASGMLLQKGWGPAAMRQERIAVAAGAAEAPAAEAVWREWKLDDPDLQVCIGLLLKSSGGGNFELRCALETYEGSPIDAREVSIEVLEAGSGALVLSGSSAEPVFLECGNWLVRVACALGGHVHRWEIPLAMERTRDA